MSPGTESAKPLLSISAAELFAQGAGEEIQWIARPYVARGAITMVSAEPKLGKSTLLLHLAAQVCAGTPFLGEPTIRCPVFYLTEERDPSMREALRRAGLEEAQDFRIVFWSKVAGIEWPDAARRSITEALSFKAGLLVVDTLPQFAGLAGDTENNAGAALAACKPLQEAAAKGIAVVAAMHDRKGGGGVGQSMRGSSAFTGACDVVLQVTRVDGPSNVNMRKISARSRFEATPDQLVVEFTEDQGYVGRGSSTRVAVVRAGEAALKVLPANEADAFSEKKLLELLKPKGVYRKSLRVALENLVRDGLVVRRGGGVKADPHLYSSKVNAVPRHDPRSWTETSNGQGQGDLGLAGDSRQPGEDADG